MALDQTNHSGTGRARKRVTIADLAQALGLTKSTVSRALNNYPDIAKTTRTRVAKAAREMGYRPLAQAQAIRTGLTQSIGLVLEVSEHDGHRPFVAEFLAGLSEGAAEENWTLTVTTARDDAETLSLLDSLSHERKVDGFVLPRTHLKDARVAALKAQNVPFILYGRTGDPAGCAWYDIEGEHAMKEAVTRLAALGHRRIGFVAGAEGYTYAALRQQGYRAGLAEAGLAFDPALQSGPAVTAEMGRGAADALLDAGATALVFTVDRAAVGAYEAVRARGLRVGRDISIISYDGIPEGTLLDPPLTTYRVDTRAAGKRLAGMLIALIRGGAPEDHRELARAHFIARGSHGPCRLTADTPE